MGECFPVTNQVCGELYGRTRTRREMPCDLRALCNSFPRSLYLLGRRPDAPVDRRCVGFGDIGQPLSRKIVLTLLIVQKAKRVMQL